MPRVEGKVAIVTGAASGLGLASSKKLIQEGARVVLTDINQQALDEIQEHFREFSETQYSTAFLDVTSEDSWQEIIEKVELEYGKINVLINSAGISLGSDIVSTDFEVWKKVHQVNLDSVFLGCKYVIPKIANYGPGSIIELPNGPHIIPSADTGLFKDRNPADYQIHHKATSPKLHLRVN